ncbi:MAG: flagellar hook-basal body complex protein [Pseudomonadales bacterium]
MTFNTALSGLSAASADLRVTGNNIANSSTVGFKASRAQFADVYASTLLGSGSNQIGSGVKLANVAQQFDQGTISFTNNALDLAVDGRGFFVLSDEGARSYSRAGMFGVDEEGFITSASGARVQGFGANGSGNVSSILGDLQLQTSNLAPARTTRVEATLNLDAREPVLSSIGTTATTLGSAIGVAQAGIAAPTASVLEAGGAPTPFDFGVDQPSTINAGNAITPFDFRGPAASTFEVQLSGASNASENQTVTVTLDSNITSLQALIDDIRDDLVASGIGVDVRQDPDQVGRLQFYATSSGEDSLVAIDPNNNAAAGTGVVLADVEAVLGGISLGAGSGGSTSTNPNPNGGTGATAQTGTRTAATFELTLSGAASGNGTVTIRLDRDVQNVDDLISVVRDDLAASGIGIDVRRNAAFPDRIEFYATQDGEPSTIAISNIDASNVGVSDTDVIDALNLATGVTVPGVPAVTNGYVAQSVDVVAPDGSAVTVSTADGATAAEIAGQFSSSAVPGVSASGSTTATIPAGSYVNGSGTLALNVNGVAVAGTSLAALSDSINAAASLGTISATIDGSGNLVISDQVGNDIRVEIRDGAAGDSLNVQGAQAAPVTLAVGGTTAAAVGGTVEFTLDEGVTLATPQPAGSNLFGPLTASSFTPFELNTFDPTDQETYNAATSATIYDSLGNPHVLSMYFVKDRFDPAVPSEQNSWTMHVQIDGRDVGDPNPNLPVPQNIEPTPASYRVRFNSDGSLDPSGTDPVLISNWIPLNEDGDPNGAQGPLNQLLGGSLPVADPPVSSNFEIRLGESTQFGTGFALNSVSQNGYTSGELSGLAINDQGLVDARFTNGQSQTLGQIALADFANLQGLKPMGDTGWVQTSDSGEPVIAGATSGSLGAITSGALEDSNVELSEQLVQLLIAQRNFQANARTISTSDEITQTIINL